MRAFADHVCLSAGSTRLKTKGLNRMNKSTPLTALALAASVSTSVYAQTSQNTELEPIIVSGGISPVAADEFGRSNTIITRRDIEDSGYATVQQALEAQPGISINGTGPSERQVRIRGGEGNHTLVLIDGVRAAAGDREYQLRSMDAASIQRIEILRGPQSVPFGTDAGSGVINIITREAEVGLNFGGSIEFGEGDRENGYLTYGSQSARFSMILSNLNDEGFDYSGGNGKSDRTLRESGSVKGELDLTDQTQVGFSLRFADAIYDLDGFDNDANNAGGYIVEADNTTNLNERASSIYVDQDAADGRVNQKLRFDRTTQKEKSRTEQFGQSSTDFKTELVNYRLQAALDNREVSFSNHLLSLLVERREDSDRDGDNERKNDSVAIEYRGWLSDNTSLQVGIRRDDNSEFSNETTWNIAGSHFLESDIRLHASGGRAVVNPGFDSIFGSQFQNPNPELVPEKNTGYDIGIEFPLPELSGHLDFTYFNEVLKDKIQYQFDEMKSVNIFGESDRQGVEVEALLRPVDSVDVTLSYTYTDATDPNGDVEIRRPRNELGLKGSWRLPNQVTTLSGDVRYVDDLFDNENWKDDRPTKELPNFTVVNLAATHSLTEHVDLTARVTNAFDEHYQEVWGYATRGRAAFVGIRTQW